MGVPMIDLKAGDEVFAQTMRALAEQAEGGGGARIDVSMGRAAASWLQTTLPLLDLGASAEDVRRSGNDHREFVPVNVYETADSWLYLAIGNDVQWKRLVVTRSVRLARSAEPGNERGEEGRARAGIHAELAAAIRTQRTDELLALLRQSGIVVAPVNPVSVVREMPGVREHLTRTTLPDGRQVRLPPAAVETGHAGVSLSPRATGSTPARSVLEETGLETERDRQPASRRSGPLISREIRRADEDRLHDPPDLGLRGPR